MERNLGRAGPPVVMRSAAPPAIESPDTSAGDRCSPRRSLGVLFIHSQNEPPTFSNQILTSYGGHVLSFEVEPVSGHALDWTRLSADPSTSRIDLILLDLSFPDISTGLDFFCQIRSRASFLPLVVLCDIEDEALAIEALRLGALDYALKQELDDRLLGRVLRQALDRHRLIEELDRQKKNLAASESVSRKMVGQLREEIEKRKRTEKLKEDFINTASHELRSPLTVIKGAVDNLKEGILGTLSDSQMNYIDITSRHVDRLAKIVDNLLDLSRIESGKAKMVRGRVDAGELIQSLARDFQIMAKEHGVLLKVDVPEDLPSVYADADMLGQVLINLLSNALKFSKRKIVIRATVADRQKVRSVTQHTLLQELIGVQFTVEDDGVGISAENMKYLFNKFVQLHRPEDVNGHKGTGLGLAICKEIVELHQGKIWVESRHGRGTHFHFILPKFDDEIAIHALIGHALDAAEKNAAPLSLLVLTVNTMDDLRGGMGPEEFETVSRRIREEVETKVLRNGDRIEFYPAKSAFVILVQSGMEGATSVKRRMRARLEDLFRDWPTAHPVFGVGIATFPASGRSLLQHAFDRIEAMV